MIGSFQVRVMAKPEDIETAINLMLTSLLEKPVKYERSRKYDSGRNPKYRERDDVRVYVNVSPASEKQFVNLRGQVIRETELQWADGRYDIEIAE